MNNPRLFAFIAALSVTAPMLSVFAQQPAPSKAAQAEAASRFKKGFDLFNEGDFQAALIELRRANELAPNYNVLYNIGQVYFQLQDYANALTTLERYLAEGGKNVTASRRAEVEKDIDKLKSRVANLEITVNVPDAEITIDDAPMGKSPLAKPVLVSAGKHKISISKVGFSSASKTVEIASAELLKVPFEITESVKTGPQPGVGVEPPPGKDPGAGTALPPHDPVPSVKPPPTTGGPEVPPPPKARPVPVVGWVVTGVLAAGAGVFGGLALGASGDLKTLRASTSASREGLDDAKSKTQTFALVSDILTGGAVIAAGVSLYFTISGSSPAASDAKPKGAPGAPATPAPGARGAWQSAPLVKIGLGPGGVRVVGAF